MYRFWEDKSVLSLGGEKPVRRGKKPLDPPLFGEKAIVKSVLFAPIAAPFDVDDLAIMEEPVQDSRGDDGISKQFLPVDKAFVRMKIFNPTGDSRYQLVAFPDEC